MTEPIVQRVTDLHAQHPKAVKIVAGGLIVVGVAPLVPAIVVGSLNLVGFGSGGVKAGNYKHLSIGAQVISLC